MNTGCHVKGCSVLKIFTLRAPWKIFSALRDAAERRPNNFCPRVISRETTAGAKLRSKPGRWYLHPLISGTNTMGQMVRVTYCRTVPHTTPRSLFRAKIHRPSYFQVCWLKNKKCTLSHPLDPSLSTSPFKSVCDCLGVVCQWSRWHHGGGLEMSCPFSDSII